MESRHFLRRSWPRRWIRRAAACSTTRSARRPVHARRRGGVHAARRRDVRPRPAHRHGARRRRRARARAADQPRADAVRARDHDARLPHGRRRRARSCASSAPTCRIAHERGLRVGSAGTHPFSLFERQRITAKDRYRPLVDQMQYVARRELIFGMHVHVAVDAPEKAIQVVNGLIAAAGAARSRCRPPRRSGAASRPASTRRRQMVFAAFPRSGPPPRFQDYADYAEVVNQLERTGCIADYTQIWWDIRPHPRLGTIEVRICDGVTRVEHAIAIAAYCQALVKHLCERSTGARRSSRTTASSPPRTSGSRARYGLQAPIMDLETGKRNRIPVAQLIRRTLSRSSRTRASSARRPSWKGSPRSSRAATAPTGSSASSTRTAISSRSSARSPTRPRPRPFPPPPRSSSRSPRRARPRGRRA